MTEVNATVPAETPAKQPRQPKPRREQYEVKLLSPKGTEMLRFKGEQNKSGGFKSFGFHNTMVAGKKAPGKGRGATQSHETFAEAQKAVDKAAAKAVELGWIKQAKRAGNARVDSFDFKSIPAPTK